MSKKRKKKKGGAGNTIWKKFEREVSSWFHSMRNPLSGRSNVDDSGKRRLGDSIFKGFVIECKTRDDHAMLSRAIETSELAQRHGKGKPFFHFERKVRDKKLTAMACSTLDMKLICEFLWQVEVGLLRVRLVEGELETERRIEILPVSFKKRSQILKRLEDERMEG